MIKKDYTRILQKDICLFGLEKNKISRMALDIL